MTNNDNGVIKRSFPISGMSCASCAMGIEKRLANQSGVSGASVNFANNSVILEYNQNITNAHVLRQSVMEIGYDMYIDDGEDAADKQEEKNAQQYKLLKRNTYLAWIFSVPIMVISMLFMHNSNLNYLLMLLTLPVLVIFGKDFFINGWNSAIRGSANMDTLVALSTSIAFIFSSLNTLMPKLLLNKGIEPFVYYEAATMIIAFVLLGKLLEERAKSRTSSSIKKLMGLQPKTATVIIGGEPTIVSVSSITKGDYISVKPGERIPVDGIVNEGFSFVDESMISGEPIPVSKSNGDKVFAGTINQKGNFIFEATKVGGETLLANIIKMVREAQGSKAPVQRIADKIASIFVPVVIVISILTFILWIVIGGSENLPKAILSAVSVLVIACPCALGLATPTALMVGIGKGAQEHILIKDATALEQMKKVNAVVLDKTGTLTEGRPVVTDWIWLDVEFGLEQKKHLYNIVLSAEERSEHPLAFAITDYIVSNRDIEINRISMDKFESVTGQGVYSEFDNEKYFIGSIDYASVSDNVSEKAKLFANQGKSIVLVFKNDIPVVLIAIWDKIKENSKSAVQSLTKLGIEVHMLTGDNNNTARTVSEKLGIQYYKSSALPQDKEDYISDLQSKGKIVAMVGDGINDSQALSKADVSIAMGTGTDIAMDVAMMTLITSDISLLPKAFDLSKRTVKLIKQNLFWAFIYNIIGIPIAAGLLYPITGVMLSPMIAAAAMAFSSFSVVMNSLRLNRWG